MQFPPKPVVTPEAKVSFDPLASRNVCFAFSIISLGNFSNLLSSSPCLFPQQIFIRYLVLDNFPGGAGLKNLPTNAGEEGGMGSVPEWGRFPGVGNGNPL